MFSGTRKLQQQQMSSTPQLSSGNIGRSSHNNSSKHHNNGKKPLRPKRKGSATDETNNINQQQLIVQPINLEGQQQQLAPQLDINHPNLGYIDQDGKFIALSSVTMNDRQQLPLTEIVGNGDNGGGSQSSLGLKMAQQSNVQLQQIVGSQQQGNIRTAIAPLTQLQEGSVVNNNGQLLYVLPNKQPNDQRPTFTVDTQRAEPLSMGIPLKNLEIPRVDVLENHQLQAVNVVSTVQDIQAAAVNAAFTTQNSQVIPNNNLAAGGTNDNYDSNVIIQPRPSSSSTAGKPKILYYDPLAATVNGQLHVPQVVYDADGNEVDLNSLQSSSTEIYIEPPSLTQQQQSLPAQQLSRSEFQSIASEPPAEDQYIIITTVAVMALLVGALSARKLRSRNFMSSCIENEDIEDDVAYDVATTAGDYSTFSAGNWKGDLEKFDV